jgi:5-formyltetrahydrofolate cyclo-ligase
MESESPTAGPSDKAALRARIRARRTARTTDPRPSPAQAALSSRVRHFVEAADPTAVVAYAALPGEPSLDDVLEDLISTGVPVLLPATRKGRPLLLGRATAPLDSLPRGTWDIREPAAPLPVAEARAEVADAPASRILVLTPGLAFDARGARLGNGGGFYDRTFGPQGVLAEPQHASLRARLAFAGVCWDDEVQDSLPVEPWDLRVSRILTDARSSEVAHRE